MTPILKARLLSQEEEIIEREEGGLLILSPGQRKPIRRILFVNCSGGPQAWWRFKEGLMPGNRLWGCPELVRMGYEVAIADALPDFYLHRNPLPHDLRLLRMVRSWLGPDDIIYCAHNVLYWLPFLKVLGAVRCRIVSLLYAREPLNFSRAHSGIIALNPAAAEHARKLAPRAKVAHLSWGADLDFYPELPYRPEQFLSCGRTHRDDRTLSLAAAKCQLPIRIIWHLTKRNVTWPANVELAESGGREWENKLPYHDLLHEFYDRASASLLVVDSDPSEYTACGFTGLIESMAMSRPVILTRTSALRTEIDVEKAGCGLHVPPENPDALAEAIQAIAADPRRSQAMGETGRRLCEGRYNINCYARGLHDFFESF